MKFGMYMNIGWYNATKIIFSCYNTQAWSCEEGSKFEVIKKREHYSMKKGIVSGMEAKEIGSKIQMIYRYEL